MTINLTNSSWNHDFLSSLFEVLGILIVTIDLKVSQLFMKYDYGNNILSLSFSFSTNLLFDSIKIVWIPSVENNYRLGFFVRL